MHPAELNQLLVTASCLRRHQGAGLPPPAGRLWVPGWLRHQADSSGVAGWASGVTEAASNLWCAAFSGTELRAQMGCRQGSACCGGPLAPVQVLLLLLISAGGRLHLHRHLQLQVHPAGLDVWAALPFLLPVQMLLNKGCTSMAGQQACSATNPGPVCTQMQ